MEDRLSALTPSVVNALYNIRERVGEDESSPTFLFLVGAPGSGKSSGHAHAIEAGVVQPGNYATINIDTLLESLLPFRAASSIAQYLRRKSDLVRFSTISAYGTRKENLGLFKWYDDAHADLAAADPVAIRSFNRVRARFMPLKDHEAEQRLLDINEDAIQRAIANRNHIVYETTLSLTKAGRVNKVDAIMRALKGTGYNVVFYHIRGTPEDIGARIRARQDRVTPALKYPFYRFLPSSKTAVTSYIKDTQAGFDAVRAQYGDRATFEEFENPTDPLRLPKRDRRSARTRRRQIMRAYGPGFSSSPPILLPSQSKSSMNLYVSSNTLSAPSPPTNRFVSSDSRKTRRSK